MVLRPRSPLTRVRVFRWYPPISVILLAAIAVVSWVVIGWSPETLAITGAFVMLVGGAIELVIITSYRVTVRGGGIAVRRPLYQEVVRPISTVTRVTRFSPQSRASRRVAGSFYALTVDDGTTLAIVAERRYPRDDLSAFLALLPVPESVENALSRRDMFRTFKVSAPLSVRDLLLVGLSYVLVFGGFALIIVAALAIHR
jgi:hypothetical protein